MMRWPWRSHDDAREASRSLFTLTPLTVKELEGAVAIVLKVPPSYTAEGAAELKHGWLQAVTGTPIHGIRVFVVTDDVDIEIIRKQSVA